MNYFDTFITLGSLVFFSACNSSGNSTSTQLSDGISQNDHRVFVSSTSFTGDMNGDPDAECETLRTAAGLERNYKAIISTSTTDAKDRITDNGGSVYIIDNNGNTLMVAASVSDLWDTGTTPLINPIELDENGDATSGLRGVLTGTNSLGLKLASGGDFCADWTSGAVGNVILGDSDANDTNYLNLVQDGCHTTRGIYCISQ